MRKDVIFQLSSHKLKQSNSQTIITSGKEHASGCWYLNIDQGTRLAIVTIVQLIVIPTLIHTTVILFVAVVHAPLFRSPASYDLWYLNNISYRLFTSESSWKVSCDELDN